MSKTERDFPPPSTSLEPFLGERGEERFRRLVSHLLQFSATMLETREIYAAILGITPPQYSILMAVADAEETTVSQLAAQLNVAGSFVTLNVGLLVKAGILAKAPNPADRRSSIVRLTEAGRAMVLRINPLRKRANDLLLSGFSEQEVRELPQLVERLVANVLRAVGSLRETAPGQ